MVFLAGVLSSEARGDGPIHDPFFAIFLSSTGEGIRTEWLQLLHGLWLEHRASVNWCFGNSEARAYKVLQKSLPTPFPLGKPEDDDVCNATSRIGPFICEKQDAIEYYQVCSENWKRAGCDLICLDLSLCYIIGFSGVSGLAFLSSGGNIDLPPGRQGISLYTGC